PLASCEAEGPQVARGPQAAVLIIDNALSSGYRLGDATLLERSKERARGILDQLGPEAEVAVLATAEGADPPTELSRDHLRLRDRIRGIEPSARPGDLTAALRRAGLLTAGSSQNSRTIYLPGVPAAAALTAGEAPWPNGAAPELRWVDPAEGAELDTLAVTGIEIEPDPDSGARGVRVIAELTNHGGDTVRERGVALRIDGRVVARGLVTVEAGRARKKRFTAVLPSGARAAEITVEAEPDRLALDDQRHALAELRAEIPILLVNGDPSSGRYEDELFYLSAALRPGDRADSGARLRITAPEELGEVELDEVAVVVLANVPALPTGLVTRLRQFVEAGGGLLIAAGDNLVVDAYNERMLPLLPQRLSGVVDLVHGARGEERSGRALRLSKLEVDHPVFSVFPPDAPGLREAGYSRVVLVGPTTDVGRRRVLARYD